jgi:sporulation protein YqfC
MRINVFLAPASHILWKRGGDVMAKRRSIFEAITMAADLPDEAIPGLPLVEIAGDRRVLIENHQGVVAYGTEQICVKVTYGTLSVCGCRLELTRMTKGQLIVSGITDKVVLYRSAC